jgi:aldose 1-epimerase
MFAIERRGAGRGAQIELIDTAAGTRAAILPNYGLNCVSFCCPINGQTYDLIATGEGFPTTDASPSLHGTPILAPFPNRIRAGRFRYAGAEYALPCNDDDANAIHGFVMDQPWRVECGTGPEAGAWLRGEFQLSRDRPSHLSLWPADFRLTCTIRLRGFRLSTEVEVENPDRHTLPFGFGMHPYFRFPLAWETAPERCVVQSPARLRLPLADGLPTGAVESVTGAFDLRSGQSLERSLSYDGLYTGLEFTADGTATHRLIDREARVSLDLTHGTAFPFTVVFRPTHLRAVCIEPYTCTIDALNRDGAAQDTGLWHLAPGERRRMSVEYVVGSRCV